MSEKVYTTGDVAKLCKVNFRTVIRWIQKGYLQAYQLPGRGDNRILHSVLVNFMRTRQLPLPPELLAETGKRILVVDDETEMANAIQRVLRRNGYQVNIATNGFAAGHLLISYQPHLITLDLRMPGLDGHQVLKLIRDNQALSHIQVLIISAQPDADIEKALNSGANAVLAKPFDNAVLLEKVQALIGE